MNEQSIINDIQRNFKTALDTVECILDPMNPIKSLLVYGPGGVGKTYNIARRLQQASDAGECNYTYINSKCTTIGLVKALWEARLPGSVLLADDVDVFNSEDSINILKAAFDTSDVRTISYNAVSNELRKNNIPNEFQFSGKVIFITNNNLRALAESKSKLSSHAAAFITRSVYVDLGMNDNNSIILHMQSIIKSTNILKSVGSSQYASFEIFDFIKENRYILNCQPSLRLIIQIAGYYKQFPDKWKEMAKSVFTVPVLDNVDDLDFEEEEYVF